MNKNSILNKILADKELGNKYWPNEDVKTLNVNTILTSSNPYLKSLHYLLEEKNTSRFPLMRSQILTAFKL